MGNPMPILVPWYVRLIAGAALIAACVGFGWVKGAASSLANLKEFKHDVVFVGKDQQAKYAEVAKVASDITKDEGKQYEKGNSDLRRIYGPGRVLHNNPGSSPAAIISETTKQPDVAAADAGLGAGVRQAAPDDCKGLKSDAAVTTLQLLRLQSWIERQQLNWDGKLSPQDAAKD